MDLKRWRTPKVKNTRVFVPGVMAVFFLNKVIALVDQSGRVIWRDPAYGLDLVNTLVESPSPEAYKWS